MEQGNFCRAIAMASLVWIGTFSPGTAATSSSEPTEDAFVAAGGASTAPNTGDLSANNYGGAGTLAIAPASSAKGEFQSLLKFNLASIKTSFDMLYGAGQWQITSITLTLASNFAQQGQQPNNNIFNTINGGGFVIEWLADDNWQQGTGNPGSPSLTGVNYDSLSTLLAGDHEVLGNYTYVPPGNPVSPNPAVPLTWTLDLTDGFLADAEAMGDVSFLLYASATSGASYLFNSTTFATNHPTINVTAVPEPGSLALLGLGALAVVALRRFRRA